MLQFEAFVFGLGRIDATAPDQSFTTTDVRDRRIYTHVGANFQPGSALLEDSGAQPVYKFRPP